MEAIKTDPVLHDFFYLELTAGLRLDEICGLKWEDFDEKKGTLKIQRSIGRTVSGKNITVGDPKPKRQGNDQTAGQHLPSAVTQKRKTQR